MKDLVFSPNRTFLEQCIFGETNPDMVDYFIDFYDEGRTFFLDLQSALGLSDDQHNAWVLDGRVLEQLVNLSK